MTSNGDGLIRLEEVFKIYGPQPLGRAFDLAKAGLSKDEVQRRSDHVVGLNNLNFSVAKGEIFVIMGLSGSGKSTALRSVNKLLVTSYGKVWVEGVDVQQLHGRELQSFRREKMGMVFQHFALFPHRSVVENVAYGLKVQGVHKRERHKAAMDALSLVGLEAYADNLPEECSGGMQQRVGLARALASDPDILLMDEAFSALDPLIRSQMQDEMLEIQSKLHKTILFITHDLNEALKIGDRVCIMKDGAVDQIGTAKQILTEPATAYVADFVQDVDQGRVIEVKEVMRKPSPVEREMTLSEALKHLGDSSGEFVVDSDDKPVGLLTLADGLRTARMGNDDLETALRQDFETTRPDVRLSDVYAAAGRGLPIAVLGDDGQLTGTLDPRLIMEKLGQVERLMDDYERQVYL